MLAGVAYLAALAVVGALALLVVMVLAGPHSDLLPGAAQGGVLIVGWLVVVVIPAMAARQVWRRAGKRPDR
ncbi:hypothetical protein [Immundisolibacter cernigliae]|uniref:Uncharacterized protein n=1 Tax=Immundisolibacter cernigliae TaxID=1810504 RepID=A0A1B1YQV9_9GAMM|nr:hypothetical protein [Immundisolibacter cernigliae]ANX03139.1 hypothetical protein PG2T_02330 [Immundisolibacter cernigliae]